LKHFYFKERLRSFVLDFDTSCIFLFDLSIETKSEIASSES